MSTAIEDIPATLTPGDSGGSTEQWQPPITHDLAAKRHGAEVDFDADEFGRLLDDLGIGPERSSLSGIEFAGYIYSHDDSYPNGRYDIKKRQIYVRVMKRVGLKYALTRKQEARNSDKINKDLVHETHHFFQHLGHLATGEDYHLAMQLRESNKRLEDESYAFADQNANKYQIVRSASLARPRAKHEITVTP